MTHTIATLIIVLREKRQQQNATIFK